MDRKTFMENLMQTAREQKICDAKDAQAWALAHPGTALSPFMFGCPDWEHNECGELDDWFQDPFKTPLTPEEKAKIHPKTREEQRYREDGEFTSYDCTRSGWSGMVDQGISNDYWREKGLYYDHSKNGII